MTGPDPRVLLALDEPLTPLPADLGARLRREALARRRRRRGTSAAAAVAVVVAGTLVVTLPQLTGSDETLSPAPAASQPAPRPTASPLAEGEVVPELAVPPCTKPGGYQRIQAVPGQQRRPERLLQSVPEQFSIASGYLPEVEAALVDTAPAVARVDCASQGTMIFLVGDDGSYLEIYSGVVNPLHVEGYERAFSPAEGTTFTTPGGARVRIDETPPTHARASIWAGRYDVSVSSRSGEGGAGLPLPEMRAFVDRLGDRLMQESARRGEVPVDMVDRTPNPPPQYVVDRVLATAPEGSVLRPPDPHSTSQAVSVALPHPDGRTAASVLVMSTTGQQREAMTAQSMREAGDAELEDETDGWPPGLLVGVGVIHNQILIQYEDSVFLNFIADDPTVVSRERLRQWAMDVVEVLGDPGAAGEDPRGG